MLYSLHSIFILLLLRQSLSQCDSSKAKLSIDVQYDGSSNQTTFELNGEVLPIAQVNNLAVSFFRCIDTSKLYKISVKDQDGITGTGFASISVNDRLIASVSEFSSEVAYYFVPDTQSCGTKPRFVLDLKLDASPTETLWNLSDDNIIISQVVLGKVDGLANMFVTVDKCIDAGSFTFTITDSDGIADPGFFRVFVESTLQAVGGGNNGFKGTFSTSFITTFVTLPPTVSPTPFPTSPPTSPPTPFPTSSRTSHPTPQPTKRKDPCDDSKTIKFLIDDVIGEKGCRWVKSRRAELKKVYCSKTHPSNAYEICAETCLKCQDTCQDSKSTFEAFDGETRDCKWLENSPINVQARYCIPKQKAFTLCKETCDNCLA